jgi:hypothetical protein
MINECGYQKSKTRECRLDGIGIGNGRRDVSELQHGRSRRDRYISVRVCVLSISWSLPGPGRKSHATRCG